MKFFEPYEYQEKVQKLFLRVKSDTLGNIPNARFEHIGASSIPGSVSKGDLDIFVGVNRSDFEKTLQESKAIGFCEKDGTLRTDELCMMVTDKYNYDVALQVVVNGSEFESFIKFRDFMITRPDLVEELNALKRSCSDFYPDDYSAKKSNWVQDILKNL